MKQFFVTFGLNVLAANATGICLAFAVLDQTGEIASVGISMGVYYLPSLLSPWAGRLVDRMPTTRLLAISNAARIVMLLGFFGAYHSSNPMATGAMFALLFGIGLCKLPQGAIFRKVFTTTIKESGYVRANAAYSTVANGSALAGVALGGMLIDIVSTSSALLVAVALFVALFAVMGLLPRVSPAPTPGPPKKLFDWDLSGFGLGALVAVAITVQVSLAPFESLGPSLMQGDGFGASGYSAMLICLTLASISTGAFLTRFEDEAVGALLATGVALAVAALCLASLAAVLFVPLLWGAALLWGVASSAVETYSYAQFHKDVPIDTQGAFFGKFMGLETLMNALLLAGTGIAGSVVGETATFALVGIAIVVSVGLMRVHQEPVEVAMHR